MGLNKRNKVSAEFSMSSLTDIIFLLLIFFMLTSTLVSPNALNLKLPTSSSKTVAPSSIPISLTKGGKWYVDGKSSSSGRLESDVRKRMGRENKSRKDITLTIVAERGVPIENVVTVMDLALKLRVNCILATDPAK